MTNIDQFESVFKAADKKPFAHETVQVRRVLVVTDADSDVAEQFVSRVRSLLNVLDQPAAEQSSTEQRQWRTLGRKDYGSVGELLERVREYQPDLICTYRNLFIPATEFPHSLGVYVDVLTQATKVPILLLPRPDLESQAEEARGIKTVMAITDHLVGDHHLVSFAAEFVPADGTLWLSHVEDEQTFDRYIDAVAKIPEIDTDVARERIMEQLLKEPRDYIGSCREVLASEGLSMKVDYIVTVGHQLSDYKRLVEEHSVDLLVMNTKDADQLAIHGLAYPLSVELRDVPLLLL